MSLRPPDLTEAVAAQFVARHLRGRDRAPAYVRSVEARFANHVLPTLGKRDIRTITRREIITLLDQVHDTAGPMAANLTLANLSTLFRWARQRDLIETIPTDGIAMPGATVKRDRVLDDRELALVMRAARRLGYPHGSYIQLLALTALRRSEAATLQWTDIDLASGVITIPAERMKGKKAHIVPLAAAVMDLLAHCSHDEPFVFGAKLIVAFDRIKEQIDGLVGEIANAPLAPWTLHDLRRSMATGAARLGVTRFIVARALAHADREVTSIYDRFEYLPEKRAALEKWAAHVTGLLQPQPVEVAHGH
jgi:integrase